MWRNHSIHLSWAGLILSAKIAATIGTTMALFSQDLIMLFSDALQSETTSYLLAIPFLWAYLIYRKRKMLRATIPLRETNPQKTIRYSPIICGILLVTAAVLLYWHGSYTFTPLEYHVFSLPIFAAGLVLVLFNAQTLRQLAFPIAFLFFLMPPPSEVLYWLGATLSTVSSESSNAVANAVGIPSYIVYDLGSPTLIITRPDGSPLSFTVDIACSGIYSIIGFMVFAGFVSYIIRDRLWKKLSLFVLGIPLVYSLNIIRITIIVLIGYSFGEQIALELFHLLGGWILLFLGTLLLLFISEAILKTRIFAKPAEKCSQCNPEPRAKNDFCLACGRIIKSSDGLMQKLDLVKVAAIVIGVLLLVSIQAPVFTLTQAQPMVIIDTPSGQQASTEILPDSPNYTLSFWYRDTLFEARAKQDLSLIYVYSPTDESREPIWVLLEIGSTGSSLHRWETCLITWPLGHGSQPSVTQIELKDVQLTENPPIIGRYFAFQYKKTNQTQVVLYWYETAVFTVNSTSQVKRVKISLVAYPENLNEIEEQLIALGYQVSGYWQPIKTWSQITMLMSQNGSNLAATAGVALVAIVALYAIEDRRQKKVGSNTYGKLSDADKRLVETVSKIERSALPSLDRIATGYKEATGKTIQRRELLKRLSELEKIGVIEARVAPARDEPTQTWRTRVLL